MDLRFVLEEGVATYGDESLRLKTASAHGLDFCWGSDKSRRARWAQRNERETTTANTFLLLITPRDTPPGIGRWSRSSSVSIVPLPIGTVVDLVREQGGAGLANATFLLRGDDPWAFTSDQVDAFLTFHEIGDERDFLSLAREFLLIHGGVGTVTWKRVAWFLSKLGHDWRERYRRGDQGP